MDNKIDKSILGETHWLDDSKKEMLKMLRGIATSEVDIARMIKYLLNVLVKLLKSIFWEGIKWRDRLMEK